MQFNERFVRTDVDGWNNSALPSAVQGFIVQLLTRQREDWARKIEGMQKNMTDNEITNIYGGVYNQAIQEAAELIRNQKVV